MQQRPDFLLPEPRVRQALRQIFNDDGREAWVKPKSLNKFGRNDDIDNDGNFETIWQRGGHETLPTTNAIDSISSSSASDTETMVIEGHTISGTDLTFSVQTVTLQGQTQITLGTPLARATRAYNTGTADLVGTVYVYEDDTVTAGVPQTAANIHLQTSGANNQTLKCATAISKDDYWIITQIGAMVNRQSSASVDARLQVAPVGGVYRTRFPLSASSTGGPFSPLTLNPVIIVPPNSDVRMIADASANNTSVAAYIGGYLCNWRTV